MIDFKRDSAEKISQIFEKQAEKRMLEYAESINNISSLGEIAKTIKEGNKPIK
jgi:hypothetical protein